MISPKLITTSSHYDYEYICMWACSTQFFSSYCDTLCVSFCHKSVSQGTCNTCEGNPPQGDVLRREQSLQVDKLADTLPAVSGAPQEKNKTDKADNMAVPYPPGVNNVPWLWQRVNSECPCMAIASEQACGARVLSQWLCTNQ